MKKPAKTSKPPQPSVIMATPVPDAEADRRLRPVMDALYALNSKHALKLVQQAIQKRPGWPAARALRACIYLQTDRPRDAHAEMSQLRRDLQQLRVPVNKDAATKIHLYYQEVRQEHLAAEVYEDAWKCNMSDIQLAELAFCLYIRGNAFPNAQKLATKMHRLATAPSQKYAFWATAALWLAVTYHARSSLHPPVNTDNRMLKLGCAIMSKALDASTIPPTAELVRFATRLFKQSADYDSAVQLISHPRLVMDHAEALHLRADVTFASSADASGYRTLLSDYAPNDWGYWLRYFESVQHHPDWLEDATAFVDGAVVAAQTATAKEPQRGPYLARMELLHRDGQFDALVHAVTDYFERFGTNSVVSRDLRPWIALLEQPKLQTLALDNLAQIAARCGFPHQLHLSWLQLWFGCLNHTPQHLMECYVAQKVDNLEPTDRQRGDDYLILIAHQILPLADNVSRYDDAAAVLKAIMVLEGGLTASPFNYDIKLLLIRLYIAIGGMERVSELWDSLEVKHVQLSTLTHVVLKPLYESGHHEHLLSVLANINSLWREIDHEIPQCMTQAFQAGSINAAVDFVLFKLRLERSAVLAEAMVIHSCLHVIQADGHSVGVQVALAMLTDEPRFTLSDFTENKRLVVNEDDLCYSFWDYADYDKDQWLDSLNDETLEGVACAAPRVETLSNSLASSLVLMQLSDENGKDSAQEGSGEAPGGSLLDLAVSVNEESDMDDSKLQLAVALNLREANSLLLKMMAAPIVQVGGDKGSDVAMDVERVLSRAKEMALKIVERVKSVVGNGEENSDKNSMAFPTMVRECGKIAYDMLLLDAVAVSSFSSILVKGLRRVKKMGSKGDVKAIEAIEIFEKGRQAILTYRDAVVLAARLIHEWITPQIEEGLEWSSRLFEGNDVEDDLSQLIPDKLCSMNLDSLEKNRPVRRGEFCNQVVEKIRSSHSISCISLVKALTAIIRRLQLADL